MNRIQINVPNAIMLMFGAPFISICVNLAAKQSTNKIPLQTNQPRRLSTYFRNFVQARKRRDFINYDTGLCVAALTDREKLIGVK
uniref:Uncharacterized protein n=1 Tax=Glossina palpalis gambiensis TaxID=67801 RepID=A0A1B0B8V8_9MUSC